MDYKINNAPIDNYGLINSSFTSGDKVAYTGVFDDIEMGSQIKRVMPNSLVALMGTHPSSLPEETLDINKDIDCIIVGEADRTARELADKIDEIRNDYNRVMLKIDGIVFRDKHSNIVKNDDRQMNQDLDSIPFVSQIYDKYLNIENYFFAACDYPEVQIMTSRGCVARCTYCVYPYAMHGLKYRTRSPENIADEFAWIKENLPNVREIGIEDDTFTGNPKHVIKVCKLLIERDIQIKWYCNVRANLKKETMVWMKKAGCVMMLVGYESANADILHNVEKKVSADQNLEFSQNAKSVGIMVHGCFNRGIY